MEANREEAARCLNLGRQALASGNKDKARRLGTRSIALFATDEARAFLDSIDSASSSGTSSATGADASSSASSSSNPRQRKKRSSSRSPSPKRNARTWTPEQEAIAKAINEKPVLAFYEILDIPRSATDADIKKAYKKLALKLHPDKNSAPKADEAFKRVSRAFSVLSDPDKRRSFDVSGADPETRGGGGMHAGNFAQGFAGGADHPFASAFAGGEFDAEEIFRAFFGPGMNSGFTFHSGGFGTHPLRQRHRHRNETHQHRQQPEAAEFDGFQLFKALLMIILPMLLTMWFSHDSTPDYPRFAFTRTRNLDHEFHTNSLSVPFYANPITLRNFKARHANHVPRFFERVEIAYEETLESGCKEERTTREKLLWRARGFGILSPDKELLRKANNMKLHVCQLQSEFNSRKAKRRQNKDWS